MLDGKLCRIRHVREGDLSRYIELVSKLDNRGDYFPNWIKSPTNLRKEFFENGFSKDDYERLLIVGDDDAIVGEIVHFNIRTTYTREIGYWLFDENDRGRGYVTEAVKLLVDYLFRSRTINRLEILMASENVGSERVAQKSGFQKEGMLRQAFFMGGRYRDSYVYSMLREEWARRTENVL